MRLTLDQEHKDKIGLATKTTWQNPEYRARTIANLKGHCVSEETRKKISESLTTRKTKYCPDCGKKLGDYRSTRCNQCNLGLRKGENNSSWKGGITAQLYPLEWTDTLKESIRQRDGYECQLCSKTEEENGRKLSVHHIDYVKENLDPENLISLCNVCNTKVNTNRNLWTKYFQSKIRISITKEA